MEFRILRQHGRQQQHLLGFKKANSSLFRDLLGRIPWDTDREREVQESWLMFQHHFLQAQAWSMLMSWKLAKVAGKIKKDSWQDSDVERKSTCESETGTGGISRHCLSLQGWGLESQTRTQGTWCQKVQGASCFLHFRFYWYGLWQFQALRPEGKTT